MRYDRLKRAYAKGSKNLQTTLIRVELSVVKFEEKILAWKWWWSWDLFFAHLLVDFLVKRKNKREEKVIASCRGDLREHYPGQRYKLVFETIIRGLPLIKEQIAYAFNQTEDFGKLIHECAKRRELEFTIRQVDLGLSAKFEYTREEFVLHPGVDLSGEQKNLVLDDWHHV